MPGSHVTMLVRLTAVPRLAAESSVLERHIRPQISFFITQPTSQDNNYKHNSVCAMLQRIRTHARFLDAY
jgi:hypothetical protein